jgi:hypothetical protein
MAAIGNASRINTTNQTTTSNSYVDATNGDIASGNFTAGKKYLILAAAQFGVSAEGIDCGVRVVHGTTAFADSDHEFSTLTANARCPYYWWTVWTAVSGEDINLQFIRDAPFGSTTTGLDQIVLLAIKLSDDLTENSVWPCDGRPEACRGCRWKSGPWRPCLPYYRRIYRPSPSVTSAAWASRQRGRRRP